MKLCVRKELRSHGIFSVSHCSVKHLLSFTGSTGLREALENLSQMPQIALEPGLGGRLVERQELAGGDLLIASGEPPLDAEAPSPVGLAVLYMGDGKVAVAPEGTVSIQSLDTIIDGASTLAPVLRASKKLDTQKLLDSFQEGQSSRWGSARAIFRLDHETWCAGISDSHPSEAEKCRLWLGHVNLGPGRADDGFYRFYLPEFIVNAYQAAGVSITQAIQWDLFKFRVVGPGSSLAWASHVETRYIPLKPDQVSIQLTGLLGYVGHLKWSG